MLAPPIAAGLMETHLWAPFALTALTFGTELTFVWILPETSPFLVTPPKTVFSNPDDEEPCEGEENDDSPLRRSSTCVVPEAEAGVPAILSRSLILRKFCSHRGLIVIFGCFLVKRIGFTSESLSFQSASEAYHMNLSNTFWLRVSNTVGATIVLSVVLPTVTRWFALQSPKMDQWVIMASLSDLIVGFLVMWKSNSFATLCIGKSGSSSVILKAFLILIGMGVAGFGEGLESGLQSLGSYIVGEANFATFFSFVSMLDVSAELFGGPIMAAAYSIRGADNLSLGYCFLLSAVRVLLRRHHLLAVC
jgi:hypothetical protein